MKNKFYITTPIYYVNDKPHLGHAYTTIAADVLARFHKLQGDEVFFLVGTDEHGLKIQKKAEESEKEPQVFVDGIVDEFKKLWNKLNIKYDNFIRTTDESHKEAVKKVLQTLYDKSIIYRGNYHGLYCVGCEQFLNESDLVDGKCPDHNTIPEKVEEECYLLKMTEIQKKLTQKIEKDEFKITPEKYKKEILSFLKNQELRDISVSRKNVKWGIPLPFDAKHTSYVWFDAFLNYLTGLGWTRDEKNIPAYWPPEVQLIGKDILRVHATIWPAILMHLNIPLPKLLFTHGHIISGGKKMSKTLGNTISPNEVIEKFGVDGTRYLLLSAGTFGEDVDMTMERMTEKYNADLANGIGNLLSRTIKMSERIDLKGKELFEEISKFTKYNINKKEILDWSESEFLQFKLEQVLFGIWLGTGGSEFDNGKEISNWKLEGIKQTNEYIGKTEPWKLKQNSQELRESILKLFSHLLLYSDLLAPFLPETSEKIKKALENKQTEILFPRIK